MPENLIGQLEQWRASAAEAFADAKTQTDPEARQRMLDIAAGYKKLSQEAELLLGQKKGAGRSADTHQRSRREMSCWVANTRVPSAPRPVRDTPARPAWGRAELCSIQ
jgi:hypothetical protein